MNKTYYKQTEIGEIPEDWKVKSLGEISRVEGGGTPSTSDPSNFGGSTPWITPKDLSNYDNRYISQGERSITDHGLKNSSAKLLPQGTVLLSTRAPVGYVAIAGQPVTTNQGFRSLIPTGGTVPEYIYYLLKSNTEILQNNASGSTFQELSGTRLSQLKFAVPPMSEQEEISGLLSSLDDKIELNRKMNKTLEEIGRALFKRWFVDFDSPDNDRQHKEVELKDFVDINPREKLRKGETARYVEMKDLPEKGMWTYSETRKTYKGGSKFRNGDTLMARITPCLENGKSAFVNFLDTSEVAFGSTEFIVLRAKNKTFEEFAYYLVRNDQFREYSIRSMIGSSGRQRVQTEAIQHYQLLLPSKDLVDRFHATMQPIFQQIRANAIENTKLIATRDSLLPRLMSGKLRIN